MGSSRHQKHVDNVDFPLPLKSNEDISRPIFIPVLFIYFKTKVLEVNFYLQEQDIQLFFFAYKAIYLTLIEPRIYFEYLLNDSVHYTVLKENLFKEYYQ